MLISGQEGSGASYFSTCLIVDFLRRGHKILFFSAFPSAKIDLMNQLSSLDRENVEFVDNGHPIAGKRTIVFDAGDEEDVLKEIQRVPDIEERIIFFKNMDKYSLELFKKFSNSKLLIISGNIDKCLYAEEVSKKDFATVIFFSSPEKYKIEDFMKLEKYQGMVKGISHNGAIEVINKPEVDSLE